MGGGGSSKAWAVPENYSTSWRIIMFFSSMMLSRKQLTWLTPLAGLGCIITLGQVIYLFFNDHVLCVNQGCGVVESLLRIPPIWFNGLGAIFFFILFILLLAARAAGDRPGPQVVLLRLLVLSGMVAEGILVGYQVFVVQTLCSYCLFICFILIVMNIVAGWRQFSLAVILFGTELILFSLLQFHNPVVFKDSFTLDNGTYGVKQCDKAQRQLYLLFSNNCPHCERVLELLSSCTRCEVRFNPVQQIDNKVLPDLVPADSWDPDINVLVLKMLGIETVPVLIEKGLMGCGLSGEKAL